MKKIDPLKAKEELEAILSRKEYRAYYHKEKNTLEDLLQRLQDWLNKLFIKTFPKAKIPEHASEWISYGLVGIGIILVIVLIWKFSSRIVRENRFIKKPVSTEAELVLSTQSHLTEADRLFKLGELRSGLRHLFIAYILHLNEKGFIEARPWKTNGEYLDELHDTLPEKSGTFKLLALKFESTWYGGRPIHDLEYLEYQKQVLQLVSSKEGDKE